MTRSTKSLFSILAVLAVIASIAPTAMAGGYNSVSSIDGPSSDRGYSSATALVGDDALSQSSDPSSPTSLASIVGDPSADGSPSPAGVTSPAALVGDRTPVVGPSTTASTASSPDGFDWGDAAIGSAFAFGLAGLLGAAYAVTRRRRPRMQPSV
jgi:hypothetical protein